MVDEVLQPEEAEPEEEEAQAERDPVLVVVVRAVLPLLSLDVRPLFPRSIEKVYDDDAIPKQAAEYRAEWLLEAAG